MGPIFADYSIKYSAAIFLKVDVDQCKVNKYDMNELACCYVLRFFTTVDLMLIMRFYMKQLNKAK